MNNEGRLIAFKRFRWIVADQSLLDGKLALRDTQFSVSFVLSLLATLSFEKIEELYGSPVTRAIPEALMAAADVLDIRSPSSFTLAERIAELDIPGFEALAGWFGCIPTFHDAIVKSVSIDLSGKSGIEIYAWLTTPRANSTGEYITEKHATITFFLEDIIDMDVTVLAAPMTLNGAQLRRLGANYEFSLEGHFGINARIISKKMSVETTPGVL